MSLKKIPNKSLRQLLWTHLSTKENFNTAELIKELSLTKHKKFLTRKELIKVCFWKSPRVIRHIRKNASNKVKEITKEAFKSRSEKKKIELLTSLNGVSVPMASAILMLTNCKRYGVIDIRVWQVLHRMKSVTKNPGGVGFNFDQWFQYLEILRYYAKRYGVKARNIERTLFNVHTIYQKGRLYKN